MNDRMEIEIERTIHLLHASMPKPKKTKTYLSALLRIAISEMNIPLVLALLIVALAIGISSVKLLSMPMLTIFCITPMPMLLLLHRYALASNHRMQELEETLYYSYAEMVSARFTVISCYVFGILVLMSMVLHFTVGESFLRLALCGAVPCIFLCTVLLFLSRIIRNGEGLSVITISLWVGLCFLTVIFPCDQLLQLCSTAVYAALAITGLFLYGVCVHSISTRRSNYVVNIS